MALLLEMAKNAALAVPPVRQRRARNWRRGGCGSTASTAASVLDVFETHSAAVRRYREISGRVLEIGPGSNLGNAALFLRAGADEVVCIDVMDWLDDVPSLYDDLAIDAATLGRIRYECPCSIESASFPNDYFDIVVSHACYQKFTDPRRATMNIERMLRPGGVTTHGIDLRDNREFARPLAFLEVGDLAWRLSTSRRSPTNRWRASDIKSVFADAGLVVQEAVATRTTEVTEEMVKKFTPRFRRKTLDDLGTLGLFLVAAKPPLVSGNQ